MFDYGNKNRKSRKNKKPNSVCGKGLSFQECELAILRQAVDESESIQGAKVANSPEVQRIIEILETFLKSRPFICYGGTAINNILPKFDQFYNRSIEIPDYDFFSKTALQDAKDLADIYAKEGYEEVEAKSGMHPGTFKVYVNFIPVADITSLHPVLFDALAKEAIDIDGIKYAPPNYLRMGMYLELSRPQGDVSRWEKVLKRINLLNKHYPLVASKPCSVIDFQRPMDVKSNEDVSTALYYDARNALIDLEVVFFGGYGVSLYSRYMPANERRKVENIPDFDVLAEDPEQTAKLLRAQLMDRGFHNIKLVTHTAIGEVIPYHVQVMVGGDTIAVLYKPLSCHSYNVIHIDGKPVRVATIDTMLSLYLAFIYGNKPYFNKDRIMCMAMYLFNVQQRNRLQQKGLLKRFSISCYGKQETLEEIRATKATKFDELKQNKADPDYEYWFLKYEPTAKMTKMEVKDATQSAHKTNVPPTRTYEIVPSNRTAEKKTPTNEEVSEPALKFGDVKSTPPPLILKPRRRRTQKRRRHNRPNKKFMGWPY